MSGVPVRPELRASYLLESSVPLAQRARDGSK
jgi:hypothetical protein